MRPILILGCSALNAHHLVAALMATERATIRHELVVFEERDPEPTPQDIMQTLCDSSARLHLKLPLPDYSDYQDNADALRGIAELRAWLGHRVQQFLKRPPVLRPKVAVRKLPCWSCRRWKSLT